MAERMDHEKMRRAAETKVSGPAATDTTAASGGLELPGHAREGIPEPIPGERDNTTQTPTEASIVATTGYGGDLPEGLTSDPTVNEQGHTQSRWEGGGRISPATPPDKKRSE
jgi:hypothetical protein